MTDPTLWAEISPHLFHLLLALALICLLTGVVLSLRQNASYRKHLNLFADVLTARVPPALRNAGAAPSGILTAAAFSPASMLKGGGGASFRLRAAIQMPGSDANLLRSLSTALPPTHFMLIDRPLGDIVTATGALPPELRSGSGTSFEEVRAGAVIADAVTLKPCGIIMFYHGDTDVFLSRILATAGLPVCHLETGSTLDLSAAVELLRDEFGIPSVRAPVLAA